MPQTELGEFAAPIVAAEVSHKPRHGQSCMRRGVTARHEGGVA